ncbi:cytochrome c peroxidase [Marivirga arenosa]|uniref:Cytochrome c peroxidase n=1 Tax=Marivirga arenosa TaxID=3059076 RepID=A0AA51N8L4_9BACT|nr:cytochrome c peroxidase [Marivirga sp. ABR2-2]WMN07735.1 cytochrome c peroxidase [Marivirga sp. ABR2-2]
MRTYLPLLFLIIFAACKNTSEPQQINWNLSQDYYQTALKKAIDSLEHLNTKMNQAHAIQSLKDIRLNFKKAESYAAHINPEVGSKVNGPALPIFKEDNLKILDPIGLQAIEETLFEDFQNRTLLEYQIERTIGYLNNLLAGIKERNLSPERYFIALHEQFLRILSFGITHFDTPISHWGFEESAASLHSIKTTVRLTIGTVVNDHNQEVYDNFITYLNRNIDYLNKSSAFNEFDYYRYIRDYFNPLTKSWVALRNSTNLWEPSTNKALNFNSTTFFEKDAFNTSFFVNPSTGLGDKEDLLLGEKLFNDKRLSLSNSLSCSSCHQKKEAFSDALPTSLGASGKPLKRNAPTLINTIFNKRFFWDGRSGTIESQIRQVFNAHDEFNRSLNNIPEELLLDAEYDKLFKKAYGGKPKSVNQLIKSLAQYVASLQAFDSKFDRNMRKEETSFTELEKKGLQLYMGKALCGSCHFIPLMNGTLPPFYKHTEKEVIGVPLVATNDQLDTLDLGFYTFYEVDIHKGMFRTPTVRNSALTAPYMHNGIYNSLDEVIDFYNRGGGKGLGLAVEHQTLPFDSLSLNSKEKEALIAFLETLNSTPEKKPDTTTNISLSSLN